MDSSLLKKVYFFSGLDEEELEKLKNLCRLKKFNKGDNIFFDTEPYTGFYFVVSGMVKIYKISKDGKEHILHIVGPFNTFAEVPLFENYGAIFESDFRYPANSMAIEENTEVVLVQGRQFLEFIESSSKICMKIVSGFAKRLRHLNHHIEEIMLKDVTKRVASFILTDYKNTKKKREESEPNIKLNISKNDLAAYLGTIPETLSRTFRKLEDDEIIIVDGKKIIIKDLQKLQQTAS
ncbi:MAG TPA: Crp/Fnr family transcriptional regulator [Ignavibacteria bacterium]|nr:Crp/Fnr family transcriptional regulator [Ignavibacteria bacterium]